MYARSPVAIASSTPVTTTDCATFQSSGVNVSVEVETVPALGSPDTTSSTTLSTGRLDSATDRVAVPPASVVVVPPGAVSTTPATSSSVLKNTRCATAIPW